MKKKNQKKKKPNKYKNNHKKTKTTHDRNGTSMISLIIPPKDQISRITRMLNDEYGTASNIKSRVNRLSVLGAITSTLSRLKLYTVRSFVRSFILFLLFILLLSSSFLSSFFSFFSFYSLFFVRSSPLLFLSLFLFSFFFSFFFFFVLTPKNKQPSTQPSHQTNTT